MPIAELTGELARHGLRLRGGFATDGKSDADLLAKVPWAHTLVLVGNVGSELWEKSGAEIAAMTGADPLDRWTRQTIDPVARSIRSGSLHCASATRFANDIPVRATAFARRLSALSPGPRRSKQRRWNATCAPALSAMQMSLTLSSPRT